MAHVIDMQARTQALLRDLVAMTSEQPWLEFKANNADPNLIGKTLSAIANGAALTGKAVGYVVWGVEDALHTFVGTSFDPDNHPIGNQPFKIWLSQKLEPFHDIRFVDVDVDGKRVVLAEVPAAARSPVRFDNYAYVRVGASTTRVVDHPEIERQLWVKLQAFAWESVPALEFLSTEEVLQLLDVRSFYDRLEMPLSAEPTAINGETGC